MSIGRLLDKDIVICIPSGILPNHKKEGMWISSSEMEEPRAYHIQWNIRICFFKHGLPLCLCGKESASNMEDAGSIPRLERSLEKEMGTHSNILAWEIPWTEKPGGLQTMGSQRVRHDLVIQSVQLLSVFNSLQPHESQHVRPPCPSPTPGAYPNSCPSSRYTIQSSHSLSSPSLPALNLSQHQGLFQWVNSSHEIAKVLEFQLQQQSFQWTLKTDLL